MKTKIYLLLLFTLVFGNCYSQTVTLTSTVCGNHQLDFSFVDATGRNFFGGIDDALSWNATSNQWEWTYYGVNPPIVYYTNSYPSIPNPPCLNAGTWVQANAGCGTLTNITGDCQTGLTDVQNLTSENYFYIVPNPASDHISIILRGVPLQKMEARIFNSLGEKIYEQNISSHKTEISLSNSSNGIYFVQLLSSERIITKKIIISR